jgi:exodeoxyribonuclease V beta subunit
MEAPAGSRGGWLVMNWAAFDITGPMPTGTTLLEASAGTGKTYTVGALVTRALAEGLVTMDQLLVITFTRAASQELRERVRGQLVAAERALAQPETATTDDFLLFLVSVEPAERALRRERLREALAAFDAATICTTHQFCQLVLKSLGVAGDLDPGVQLVESLDELVEEVVDDLYLAWYGWSEHDPPFLRSTAVALGRAVVRDPHSQIAGADTPSQTPKVAFAQAVRSEVDRRKRRLGIISYDDLLARLAQALVASEPHSDSEPLAKVRMADRWRLVLVDEFQDTDPVQWQVLDRAFSQQSTMILIGDPKQAIYAFRGGDVVAYIHAGESAHTQATLAKNYRSDPELVRQLGSIFSGAALGHKRIIARPSEPALTQTRLTGAPQPEPLRIRVMNRAGHKLNRDGSVPAAVARHFVAADCASDIAALLNSGATFCGAQGERPVVAADIAVLVANRGHGATVAEALAERGVHSVVAGAGQVMRTKAAEEWMTLLNALEQPHSSGRARAAGLSAFFGLSITELDNGGEALTDSLCEDLQELAILTRTQGIAALFATLDQRGVSQRTLAQPEGTRHLTDLRHLAETLHDHAVRDGLGLAALTAWLRAERRAAEDNTERTRRLDTDAAAVQILTIHGAKGLQFPVVYVPFAFDNFRHPVTVAQFHDDAGGRMLDLDPGGGDWSEHVTRHQAEEAGEELRTLYVALTRGQSQVVTWWAPSKNTSTSALHRMLMGRTPNTLEVPTEAKLRSDEEAWSILQQWQQLGGPACERAEVQDVRFHPQPIDVSKLGVRSFDRRLDLRWRRTSYSGLIRAEESRPGVRFEPAVIGKDDEPAVTPQLGTELGTELNTELAAQTSAHSGPGSGESGSELLSPMADLPVGATFGSLVHAILEQVDPASPDLVVALKEAAREQLRWWPVQASPEALADALVPVLHTPLGPLAAQQTLAQLGAHNQLCELDFEFPLAGGEGHPSPEILPRKIWLGELADLLDSHLPPDDPIRPYAHRLRTPGLAHQLLLGYLSGSIDVVLRLPSNRFLVVDYKTNQVGDQLAPMWVTNYAPDQLAEAMTHSDYPLQALLYNVVLHRFLRWRLPDYDPAKHLGGVLYLYLRGMAGADTPTAEGHPCGVFSWQPPAALVMAMSNWLAGEAP